MATWNWLSEFCRCVRNKFAGILQIPRQWVFVVHRLRRCSAFRQVEPRLSPLSVHYNRQRGSSHCLEVWLLSSCLSKFVFLKTIRLDYLFISVRRFEEPEYSELCSFRWYAIECLLYLGQSVLRLTDFRQQHMVYIVWCEFPRKGEFICSLH